MSEVLLTRREGAVLVLSNNNPAARNALSPEFYAALTQALAQAEAYLKRQGVVNAGDVYAITCGEPMGAPGGTNMLKICVAS